MSSSRSSLTVLERRLSKLEKAVTRAQVRMTRASLKLNAAIEVVNALEPSAADLLRPESTRERVARQRAMTKMREAKTRCDEATDAWRKALGRRVDVSEDLRRKKLAAMMDS